MRGGVCRPGELASIKQGVSREGITLADCFGSGWGLRARFIDDAYVLGAFIAAYVSHEPLN